MHEKFLLKETTDYYDTLFLLDLMKLKSYSLQFPDDMVACQSCPSVV